MGARSEESDAPLVESGRLIKKSVKVNDGFQGMLNDACGLLVFPHYLIKGMIFGKTLWNIKCVC